MTRTISSSAVSGTVVDIPHYDGVKGWSQSLSQKDIWDDETDDRIDTTGAAPNSGYFNVRSWAVEGALVTSEKLDRVFATAGKNYGVNLRFVNRGFHKFKVNDSTFKPERDKNAVTYQTFMMDGRESQPTDVTDRQSNKSPTTTAVQQRDNVLCLVCHGSAEFSSLPTS